jgi:hypothetical protein
VSVDEPRDDDPAAPIEHLGIRRRRDRAHLGDRPVDREYVDGAGRVARGQPFEIESEGVADEERPHSHAFPDVRPSC